MIVADAKVIDQHLLAGDEYGPPIRHCQGNLHSRAVKDLTMPVRAAFDTKANLAAIGRILRA